MGPLMKREVVEKNVAEVAFLDFNRRARAVSMKLMQNGIKVIWILPRFKHKNIELGIGNEKIYYPPWPLKRGRRLVALLYPLYVFMLVPLLNVKAVYILGSSIRNPVAVNLFISFLKKTGKKVIYAIGDMPVIYDKDVRGKRFPQFVERILLRNLFVSYTKADLLVIGAWSTYYFVRKICKRFGGCKKILVSYYGADLRFFNRQIDPYGIREQYDLSDSFVIGWIGHGGNVKGVIPVVKALSESLRGEGISFVIGGEIDYEKLKRIEKKTGVRIVCLGPVPQKVSGRILKECDLIITPLDLKLFFHRLAFSTKIFMATAVGKPVIATVSKPNLRMVRNLPNVIVVDDKPESFVTAVQHLLEHYSEYRSISEQLSSDVINRISIRHCVDNVVRNILSMIG